MKFESRIIAIISNLFRARVNARAVIAREGVSSIVILVFRVAFVSNGPSSISVARVIIVAGNLRADDLANARDEELRTNAKSNVRLFSLIDDLHRARMLVVDGEGILSVVRRIVRRL